MSDDIEIKPKKKRGFAAMDPARVREISRMGGEAARDAGTAHVWTPEKAKEAGRKGGKASSEKRKREAALATEDKPAS